MNIINKLKVEHKFLYISLIISFILNSICFILWLIVMNDKSFISLIVFIPSILITIMTLIFCKTYNKFPKLTKWISSLFNTIVNIISLLIVILFIILECDSIEEKKLNAVYTNPAKYIMAKESIYAQYRIAHFPEEIPAEAKNIHLYKTYNSWFGSEIMLLEFDIDKKYIEKELNKYNFISIDNTKQKQGNSHEHKYHQYRYMMAGSSNFDIDNFTFYVINDREHENLEGHYFPYHYGIGVNENLSKILYYYDCPD